MGAFEDFVNANLGIRKPLITDAGPPTQSTKAAGIPGSHYIDSNNNFLYEKTGDSNSTDWIYIATLGDPRGGGEPAGLSGQIQFNYDGELGASPYFIFDDTSGAFSGASGRVDYLHVGYITGQTGHFQEEIIVGDPDAPGAEEVFLVEDGNIVAAGEAHFAGNIDAPTGTFDDLFVNGDASFEDLLVQGDLTVIGTTHVTEVIDTTVEGTISGYTGIFNNLIAGGKDVGEQIDTLSGDIYTLSGHTVAQDAYILDQIGAGGGGDFDALSGNLDLVSGEATADAVALADDIQLVSGELFLVSGVDIASSTALADDIYLINKKLPFVGQYNIPNGTTTANVSFSSVSNSNNYVLAPTVLGNVRIASSSHNVYNCSFYDVDHAGFSVKFSPQISESNNILDFTVYNND
jgi:hypothetical protein